MKTFLKSVLPIKIQKAIAELKNRYLDGYALKSYSQEGEDMILRRIFETKKTGFYVDVGAHHPQRFSNTYFFYKRGWRGINIDAMPGSMIAFRKDRPGDINIEIPISAEQKTMTYYAFNEPALNGFDEKLSKVRETKDNRYRIIQTTEMETRRLCEVLDEHLPKRQLIDFLSIDVEGLDFEVLRSNDWTKYKPEVVLVEILDGSLVTIVNSEVTQFLSSYGYTAYAKAVNTVIYKRVARQ